LLFFIIPSPLYTKSDTPATLPEAAGKHKAPGSAEAKPGALEKANTDTAPVSGYRAVRENDVFLAHGSAPPKQFGDSRAHVLCGPSAVPLTGRIRASAKKPFGAAGLPARNAARTDLFCTSAVVLLGLFYATEVPLSTFCTKKRCKNLQNDNLAVRHQSPFTGGKHKKAVRRKETAHGK
jgi:hypothetical protein